jgi:hypothetical protein
MASKGYYLESKAGTWAFKPYDWRQAKRDRHACHNLSHKLSAATRRLRREAVQATKGTEA